VTASSGVDYSGRTARGEAEISDDLGFQRRAWIAERIGWVVIAIVLVAGGLGLLGSTGPLNRASAGEAGGALQVEYARLTRHSAPTELQMTVAASADAADEVRIAISADYLAAVQVREVQPEPEHVELAANELVYVFPIAERGEPLAITFETEPRGYWLHRGSIRLADGDTLRITQFVYP
jgi:hypothetical protein